MHLHYLSVLGTTCGGHLATHSPPSNDTAQGRRHREAITQAVTGPGHLPMDQFNVLYNHHIQASVIHPHQGEFVEEVSASETSMSQTFRKTVTSCHTVYIYCFIGHKHAYLHSLVYAAQRNSIIVSDTALTLPFFHSHSVAALPW